ncbi:MAG: hypothetical protein RBT04_08610, partial [Sphaerochaetaceae bacterium]|nr:hypothetical protein [Sphaerochaetaceae bacterium]
KRKQNGFIKSNFDNELEESVNQLQQSHSKAIAQPQQSCSSAKERKKKRKKEIKKEVYGTFNNVYLVNSEYSNCLEKYGELTTRMAIEELSGYKESTGKQYKSDYAAMIRWVFKTILDAQSKQQTTLRSYQDIEFRPREAVSIYDKLSGDENKND